MAQQPSVAPVAPRAMREQNNPPVRDYRESLRGSSTKQSTVTEASSIYPVSLSGVATYRPQTVGAEISHACHITSQKLSPAVMDNVDAQNIPSVTVDAYDVMSLPYEATSAGDEDVGSGLPGSSAVWLSEEKKLRQAFISAYHNAIRLDLHNSPFFPRSVAEYAKARAHAIEKQTKSLTDTIHRNQKAAERYHEAQAVQERREHLAAHHMLLEDPRLFNELLDLPIPQERVKPAFYTKQGVVGQDWLSTVYATDEYRCFQSISPGDATPQSDYWPPLASLKMYRGTDKFPSLPYWFHGY